jgi:hypothetical protein
MNIDKKAIIFVLVSSVILSGCSGDKLFSIGSNLGPKLDTSSKTSDVSDSMQISIEVQASEERIDRSSPNWLKQYCVARIMEIGGLPSSFERQRGPFIGLNPVYLSERHSGYKDKATCSLDYYIWPVRTEAFLSMGVDYAYSVRVWNDYYEALTASKSGTLKDEGWKELVNEGEVGVKPDYSMSYFNSIEGLREYLDIFYTNDEEVVYELLVVDTGGR